MTVSGKASAEGRGARAKVSRAAEEVGDNKVVTTGARVGYAVNGLLHLLIAFLGLQVAFGGTGAKADPSGAMGLVASTPAGLVVLIAIAAGFALLAVWQVTAAIQGPRARDRVKAGAKAIVYLVLALSAVSFLTGRGGKSGQSQASDATATLMGMPMGPAIVVIVGLAVAAVGIYHIYKGWTERFRRDLASTPSRFTLVAGKVGYIARGVALIAVGIGILVAGVTHHPTASRGLDGALHDMVRLPWGQAIVALVALGFAAYGLYSFSRARRART
jgi:uncharacterized membrane protein YhaH (DUF805 family)